MAPTPESLNPNANHDAEIITTAVVFSVLAVAAIILRVVARRMKNLSLASDDYILMIAWVCALKSEHILRIGTDPRAAREHG
jgi:hypothetical protein